MAKAKIRGLNCSAPADKMIALGLRAQVRAMCRYREPALNWRDPEGVHDMRVLSRRLRSAINDFGRYFRKDPLPRTKLRTIADQLGDVRDQDVALIALKELASQAKGNAAEGIKLIAGQRKAQRKKARSALKEALTEPAVAEFQKDFLAKVQTLVIVFPRGRTRAPTPPEASSFRALGVAVIKERLKDFTDGSRCLYEPYKVKNLHELRILGKRLRYSMELFAVCFGEDLARAAKEIAQMQTSLGELHDCDVWISDLGADLKRLARKKKALEPDEIKVRTGATWLLEHFAEERMQHYRDAVARWEQWSTDGFLEGLALQLDAQLPTEELTADERGLPQIEIKAAP